MKKSTLLPGMLLLLTACSTGKGVVSGKLVDAHWGGVFFNSCEVFVQYSGTSIDQSSSDSEELCDLASALTGKSVRLTYHTKGFGNPFKYETRDIIDSIVELEE